MKALTRLVAATIALVMLAACSDTIVEPAPSLPRPEGLTAEVVGPGAVRLTWQPVTTASEPITYSVFRNETRAGEVTSTEFVDTSVTGGANVWYVTAKSGAGGVSPPSIPVSIAIGDFVAPAVIANTPAGASAGISRLPLPTITFSEAMIPASVNMSTIVVTLTTSGERVFGSVSYSQLTRTADFSPFAILPPGTSVTVTVTPGTKDLAGNSLAAPFSFAFTTGDDPASVSQLPPSSQPLLFSQRMGDPGFALPYDVFKASLDGSSITNLTNHPATDRDAAWSPDGRHVAFSSDRDGTYDIYVMRENGTALQQLTSSDKDQTSPRWASDAKRIVFTSSKEGVPPLPNFNTPFDVWAMNPDGSAQENLTKTPTLYEFWPHMSPDRSKLLFTRSEVLVSGTGQSAGIRTAILVANANATAAAPLHVPDTAFNDDVASWSPDGSRIAFSAQKWDTDPFGDTFLIYSIRPDGSDLRRITTTGSRRNPAWSPDGSQMLVSLSGFNEFWGRFGEIAVVRFNIETLAGATVASHRPGAEVMSPQAWRR